MTNMIPWKVSGVGEASRHAARAAARDQGTSVGHWLDRLILERADDEGRERPAWSESIARRAAELDEEDEGERLVPRFIKSSGADEPRPARRPAARSRRETIADDDAIQLLAEAAGEMKRRASRPRRAADPLEDRLRRLEAQIGELASSGDRGPAEPEEAPRREGPSRVRDGLSDLERKLRRAEDAIDEARYAARSSSHGDDALRDILAALRGPTSRGGDATGAALKKIYDVLELLASELAAGETRDRASRRGVR